MIQKNNIEVFKNLSIYCVIQFKNVAIYYIMNLNTIFDRLHSNSYI